MVHEGLIRLGASVPAPHRHPGIDEEPTHPRRRQLARSSDLSRAGEAFEHAVVTSTNRLYDVS